MRRLVFLIALLVAFSVVRAGDWPRFRGPNADGISPETGINKGWNARPPRTLWKVSLGDNGCAAPCVAGGVVYIVDHKGAEDIVRAISLAGGTELWRYAYADATSHRFGFTVSTPLFHEGKLYVASRMGKVLCLDAGTGREIWRRDFVGEFEGRRPPFSYAASPVVDGPRLIVLPGGKNSGTVALDRETGKTLWQSDTGKGSYATPVVATLFGRKQYLVFVVDGLFGLDVETGKVLWSVPWPSKLEKRGNTPIVIGERVFVTATEGADTGLIDPAGGSPKVVWKHKQMQCHFTTPVYYHGRIYGSSDPKFLLCLDPQTGQILWKREAFQYTSVLGVDDTVIALEGKTGALVMIDATTAEYKELGRTTPLGGQSWTGLVFADGKLLVRNTKELACLDMK